MTIFKVVEVDGLPFTAVTVASLATHICVCAASGNGGWVVTPNVDILRRWRGDGDFRDLVSTASIFTADGAPIVWASRLQGNPLPARVSGSDLFVALFKLAEKGGLRIALIGGNAGSAARAARALSNSDDKPSVAVRTHFPPLGFENISSEMKAIEEFLQDWQPQIVFIGLPCPKQEQLIKRLRPICPCSWFLGVGVSFSFVAGDVRRAPLWVQRAGLEWFHRLMQEPRRLVKRYIFHGLPFAAGLLTRALLLRLAR